MTTNTAHTTAEINSQFTTGADLQALAGEAITVTGTAKTFTVTFTDLAAAVQAVSKAKEKAYRAYVKNGGNPWNKRAFGSQYGAITRAMNKAAG